MDVREGTDPKQWQVPAVAWVASSVAIASIWVAVLLAAMVAPDLVSGSAHEHLALVPATGWIWGLVATSFVVLAALDGVRRHVANPTPWRVLAVGVAAVWVGVVVVTALGPVLVTGSDPTRIPLVALAVPILGVFLTWFVCTLVRAGFEQEHPA